MHAMAHLCFASPFVIVTSSNILSNRLRSPSTFTHRLKRPRAVTWQMSSVPEPEQSGSSAEDDALNTELQKKVNELFGSRNNVTIDMRNDSAVQFTVKRKELEADTRAAWSVVVSIAALSVVAGLLFIGLVYSGAVHGSDTTNRRYEMPSYGKSSYIDPYELLDDELLDDHAALQESELARQR